MIVNFKRQDDKKENPLKSGPPKILVDILLHLDEKSNGSFIKPCPEGERGTCEVVPVLNTLISHISSVRLQSPKDLRTTDAKRNITKTIEVRIIFIFEARFSCQQWFSNGKCVILSFMFIYVSKL